NFAEALKVLATFAEVVPDVAWPDLPYDAAVNTIVAAEGSSAFEEILADGRAKQLRATEDRWGGYEGLTGLAVDYLPAQRLRGAVKKALDELCAPFDALVAPAFERVALPIGKPFDEAYPGVSSGPSIIPAGNLASQPAVSVPNGFGAHDLPT